MLIKCNKHKLGYFDQNITDLGYFYELKIFFLLMELHFFLWHNARDLSYIR